MTKEELFIPVPYNVASDIKSALKRIIYEQQLQKTLNQENDFEQLIKNILNDAQKIRLKEMASYPNYVPGRNTKGGKGQRARNKSAFKTKFNKQNK